MADEKKKAVIEAGGDAPAPRAARVGMVEFFRQVNRERKKITWPTGKETLWTTVMVFIMVAFTMVFFFFVDTILNYGELVLIGARRPF